MLPKYREVELPLLREIMRRGGEAYPSYPDSTGLTVFEALAREFKLTAADLSEQTNDGEGRSKWEKMVRWARQKLVDGGYLHARPRGLWKLTDKGVARVQS